MVGTEAQHLLGHHKVGERAGKRHRGGAGRSSGNLVKLSPKTEGSGREDLVLYMGENMESRSLEHSSRHIPYKVLIFNHLSLGKIVLRWQKQANKESDNSQSVTGRILSSLGTNNLGFGYQSPGSLISRGQSPGIRQPLVYEQNWISAPLQPPWASK